MEEDLTWNIFFINLKSFTHCVQVLKASNSQLLYSTSIILYKLFEKLSLYSVTDVIQNFQISVICFYLFLCSVPAFVLQSGLYMFHLICVELLLCSTNKPPEETTANNELALDCRLAQHSMNRARCVAAVQKTDEQIVRHRRQEGCVFCDQNQT